MPALLALVSIIGWGSWMAIVHGTTSPNSRSRILYATLANLLVSGVVFLLTGSRFEPSAFVLPFAGGLLWGIAGAFSFSATDRLGLARAVGTWAAINTIAGLFWGALLFGELSGLSTRSYLLIGLSLAVLVAGIRIISVPDKEGSSNRAERIKGYVYVTIVGVLWGSYFIPVTASGQGPLAAAFPMSIGMAVASLVVGLIEGKPLVFDKPSHYLKAFIAGCFWAAANYAMLILCGLIGRGRGFAAIQPNLAVSALIGLFIFKEREPGSPASRRILLGALVTTAGGILFGFAR
jgi:glucose uptake protein